MSDYYRTQGFVISKNDFREADQFFNVYTKDFGKLKILGRAIRKIKSKLRSGISLFYLSEIEFIQGKNHKTLTDALVVDKFKNIRSDLNKLKIAYRILETTDTFIHGQEKDEKIFNLLNETFGKLNDDSSNLSSCQITYYYFLWNLLSILGYQIDLYNCVLCRKKLVPFNLYCDYKEGGIICSDCFKNSSNCKNISQEAIKILRILLKNDWDIISRIKITDEYERFLDSISSDYFSYIKNCHSTS